MKNTNPKKIIIIGGGIAGLTAGIYAQKHGFISEIYEKNPIAGGLCMSWKRKGFLIDGCIHWLTGTKEGTQLNEMWEDVDAFDQEDIIHPENFGTIEYQGQTLTFYTDLNKLEKHLIEISPEDTKEIKKLVKLIIKIQNMPLPMDAPVGLMDFVRLTEVGLKLLPYMPMYNSTFKMSCAQYAERFKSPLIRYALANIIPGKNNLYGTLYAYGTNCVRNGGVKRGGSLSMVQRMVDEYSRNGGFIRYNQEIKEIIIKKNKAIGIETKKGEKIYADYVVTACDAHETLKHLLKGEYLDPAFDKRFKNPVIYSVPSDVYISYAIKTEKFKELNVTHTYQFDTEPYRVGNSYHTCIKFKDYSYDDSFINGDSNFFNVMIPQDDFDFSFWEKLYRNKELYRKEKERLSYYVMKLIEERFPSLKGALTPIDVATPMTYKRYCNAYRGAYMPFGLDFRSSMLMHSGKIKGLKNLYIAGQWVQMPGGVPLALMSGKFAIQRILKQEHQWFKITSKSYVKYKK